MRSNRQRVLSARIILQAVYNDKDATVQDYEAFVRHAIETLAGVAE